MGIKALHHFIYKLLHDLIYVYHNMENELTIDIKDIDIEMHIEVHTDERCSIKERNAILRKKQGLTVVAFFMECFCSKKTRNPIVQFDTEHSVKTGEGIDLHYPGKNCSYPDPLKQYNKKTKRMEFHFKCDCNCGRPTHSYSRSSFY